MEDNMMTDQEVARLARARRIAILETRIAHAESKGWNPHPADVRLLEHLTARTFA